MQLKAWKNFSKKTNSTKIPTASPDVIDIVIKEDSNLLEPIFILKTGSLSYNYVQWEGRYYYVTDITLSLNQWYELHCKVDVLASWKSNILASTQYVLRSASRKNGEISDSLYPVNTTRSFATLMAKSPITREDTVVFPLPDISYSTYCVGIINKNTDGATGSVTYYLMNSTGMRHLIHVLMNNLNYLDVDSQEISDSLLKAFYEPFKYIVSCVALPFNFNKYGDFMHPKVETIPFGYWSFAMPENSCRALGVSPSDLTECFFDISSISHPQHSRGSYLDCEPYTSIKLYAQPFGAIDIDATKISGLNRLNVYYNTDMTTGMCELSVWAHDNTTPIAILNKTFIATLKSNIGVQMPISSLGSSLFDSIGRGIGIATGDSSWANAIQTSGQMIAGAFSAVGLGSIFGKNEPSTIGGGGEFSTYSKDPYVYVTYNHVVDDDNADNGRPLCEDVTLSTLSGYTVCMHGDIAVPCTKTELDEIGQFLTGGFFIE